MVQFADSVVIIPNDGNPYTIPVHPDGWYTDGAESLSAASLGLDGLDASFQDAVQDQPVGEASMSDFGADGVDGNFLDTLGDDDNDEGIDQSLGDAMVFSDSFVADEDFSSMSDSESTLEKEPQDTGPSDYEVIKQMGVNAGVSGAIGYAVPALMRYSSRMLNSSTELEDTIAEAAVLSNSFNNSANFSQAGNLSGNFSGAAQGAFVMQSEVSKTVMQRAMVLAARSASNSVGQGSVALTSAATGASAVAAGAVGGTVGLGMNALIVTAITTSILAGGLMGLEVGGFLAPETRTEAFLPLNISFADFDEVPSPALVPSGMQTASPSRIPFDAQTMSPSTMPAEFPASLSNAPFIFGSSSPTQLAPESVPQSSLSPSASSLEPTFIAPAPPSSLSPSTPLSTILTATPTSVESSHPTQLPSESVAQASGSPSVSRLEITVEPSSLSPSLPADLTTTTPTSFEATVVPSLVQSGAPTSFLATREPTGLPSALPVDITSASPTLFSSPPQSTEIPTIGFPSRGPTLIPSTVTDTPSLISSGSPVVLSSSEPSLAPTDVLISVAPTSNPSTFSEVPSASPTTLVSATPSSSPSTFSELPSSPPVDLASASPSSEPSTFQGPTFPPPIDLASVTPSSEPSTFPSSSPTSAPTSNPSNFPSSSPSSAPTSNPTSFPSSSPTSAPTSNPTSFPSPLPSSVPTSSPTSFPSPSPTSTPTSNPTSFPSPSPTNAVPPSVPTSPGTVGEIVGWRLVWLDNRPIADLTDGQTVDLCAYEAPVTVEALVDITKGPVGSIEFKVRNALGGGTRRFKDSAPPFRIENAYVGWSSIVIEAIPFPDPVNEGNRGVEVAFSLHFTSGC